MADEREVLLEVNDLEVTYGSGRKAYKAVKNANFTIYKGETFGLVGESGSGKTTIGRAIMRILPTSGGEVLYKGQKINGKISRQLDQQVIKEIQMIFQDPMASLNERAKVEYIIAEGLLNHHLYKDQEDLHEKVMNALHEVGLLPEFASRFPHEFSGGQRQRLAMARALLHDSPIYVFDEATSNVDAESENDIMKAIHSLAGKKTVILISHRLANVEDSDCIYVLENGGIAEQGTHAQLLAQGGAYCRLYTAQKQLETLAKEDA